MFAMDGILNLDKPYGMTSMEVVRRIKRASRAKRVGHGGTLDPVATGVVPICFGRATRIMEYLVAGTKDYRTVVEFGVTTDTYDALGKVTGRADASQLTSGEIERSLQSFKGEIDQVPPMFSALKRKGKRLYDLARAGIEVEREPPQSGGPGHRADGLESAPGDGRGPVRTGLLHEVFGPRSWTGPGLRGAPEESGAVEERTLRAVGGVVSRGG